MNDEPIILVRYDNLPANLPARIFHWSMSDDHKTLKLENAEYSRVDQ